MNIIQSSIESEGKWWFPDEPNKVFFGKFGFNEDDGGNLQIFDDRIFIHRNDKYEIILGKLADGQKITLNNCSFLRSNGYLEDFQLTKFNCQFALIGSHYNSINDIRFDSAIVKYSNISRFISDYSLTYDPLAVKSMNSRVKARKFEITGFCSIRMFPEGITGIGRKILVQIHSNRNKTLLDYVELKSIMQDFLNFVIKDEVLVDEFSAIDSHGIQVRVHYKSTRPTKSKENTNILFKSSIKTVLFHSSKMSARLQDILINWFGISKSLEYVYNLYFGVVYNHDQYDVYRFLILTTALEVYHGIRMDGSSDLKIKKREHFEKLRRKLQPTQFFSNHEVEEVGKILEIFGELSFEERLGEIFGLYAILVTRLLKNKDVKKIIRSVTDTRNYYTHYNPNKKDEALKDDDLFWITRDLQVLLQLCFLGELGFQNQEIEDIFNFKS